MKEIKTFEAFAGYGSQLIAMRRLRKDNPRRRQPYLREVILKLQTKIKNYKQKWKQSKN